MRISRRTARWSALALAVVLVAGGGLAAWLLLREDPPEPVAAVSGPPRPVVQGNRLVDARTGSDFVPMGVNWSSFEYACAQGWGYSALDALGSDPEGATADNLASWGVNTVRLPLNQDCWLGTRGAPVDDEYADRDPAGYRDAVAAFVSALNARDIVVVLDLHSRKRISTPEFGNLALPDSESLAFWRSVATAYRDNPSVMFDAFNEPYSRYDATDDLVFDLTWSCWRDGGCRPPVEDDQTTTDGRTTYEAVGMATVVETIREVGAAQPVLLGGLDYANDLSHWLEFAPDDDQLVAAFHSYDFKACADRTCWDQVLGPLSDTVPVLTSELGSSDPANAYLHDYLDWAGERRIGSLFWVWADHPNDPMALVTDPTGRPTAYGRNVRGFLLDGGAFPVGGDAS